MHSLKEDVSDPTKESHYMDRLNDKREPGKELEEGADRSHSQEEQYPSWRVVVPTVGCLYLAFFLAALVSPGKQSPYRSLTLK